MPLIIYALCVDIATNSHILMLKQKKFQEIRHAPATEIFSNITHKQFIFSGLLIFTPYAILHT